MFERLREYEWGYDFDKTPRADPEPVVSGWVGVQGFVAGLIFNVFGLAGVALLSSPDKRGKRTSWAIVGGLLALMAALGASV